MNYNLIIQCVLFVLACIIADVCADALVAAKADVTGSDGVWGTHVAESVASRDLTLLVD